MANLGYQFDKFLLALGLIVAAFGVGQLSDIHGTEFRSAHGAELSFFVKIIGKRFVMHGFGGFGIERKLKLFIPIEEEAGITESVIAITRTGTMASNVGSMGGNFVGDNALLHVLGIGQAEVLLGSDVAKHGSAVPADHGGSDSAGDVVVAGGDVDDQRAEGIERRFVAPFHFLVDLFLDFVERDVAGTFDHDLHIVLPGFFGEFTENF